jgi:hypothetical protein
MGIDVDQLAADVQFNCDVADAGFAGNYTMCIYLLKMRELYRWSAAIDQSRPLSGTSVANWVEQKEAHWESLESVDFRPITIEHKTYDPFDIDAINQHLETIQLIYGAGYGRGCRPQFYLAQLERHESYPAYDVLISGHEYARDLASPVAMSQGRLIYVRRESVRRMLWEQIESWRWRKSPEDEPLAYALSTYDLAQDPETTLDDLTDLQTEYAIHHEVGEMVATSLLGDEWSDMLMQHAGSRIELIGRAIKDHLADALVTLPELMESRNDAAVHLYFSNMSPLRKKLFPQLSEAYDIWRQSGASVLSALIAQSHEHWLGQARKLLDSYQVDSHHMKISDDELDSYQPAFIV